MTDFLTDQQHAGQPTPAPGGEDFLVVENLSVQFPTHDGLVKAVNDLSYSVKMGETLGIVGSPAPARASRRWRSSGCTTSSAPG